MNKKDAGSVDRVAQVSQWINLTAASLEVLEGRIETLSKRLDPITFMAPRDDETKMGAVPEEALCGLAVDIRNLDRRVRIASANISDLIDMLQI